MPTLTLFLSALATTISLAGCPSTDRLLKGVASDATVAAVCEDIQSSPQNCGRCGHDCLGGACVRGACQPVLLTNEVHDVPVLDDEGFVYWRGAPGSNSIRRCSVDECIPVDAYRALSDIGRYAVHGAHLFTTDYGTSSDGGATIEIHKMDKLGGGNRTLVCVLPDESFGADSIAVTDSRVLAISDRVVYSCTHNSGGGGAAYEVLLASGEKAPAWRSPLFASDIGALWTTDDRLVGFDFQSKQLKFASEPNRSLDQMVAAVRADRAAWVAERSPTAGDDQAIVMGIFPPLAETQLVGSLATVGGLALDDEFVYFTTLTGGGVNRVRIGGGSSPQVVETLAQGQDEPSSIAVDAKAVYWFSKPRRTLHKLAK